MPVDASVYYAHEFTYWKDIPLNKGHDLQGGPQFFTGHFIRAMVPGAKIIAIVREPVER